MEPTSASRSATSTTSRPSTTPGDTPSATRCSPPWRPASANLSGTEIPSDGPEATRCPSLPGVQHRRLVARIGEQIRSARRTDPRIRNHHPRDPEYRCHHRRPRRVRLRDHRPCRRGDVQSQVTRQEHRHPSRTSSPTTPHSSVGRSGHPHQLPVFPSSPDPAWLNPFGSPGIFG